MKRVAVAAAILAVILVLVWMSDRALDRSQAVLLGEISRVRTAFEAGDREETLRRTRQLEETWTDRENMMLRQIDHEHVDGLSLSVAQLEDLLLQEDLSGFLSQLNQLEKGVAHLWRSEAATWQNLL